MLSDRGRIMKRLPLLERCAHYEAPHRAKAKVEVGLHLARASQSEHGEVRRGAPSILFSALPHVFSEPSFFLMWNFKSSKSDKKYLQISRTDPKNQSETQALKSFLEDQLTVPPEKPINSATKNRSTWKFTQKEKNQISRQNVRGQERRCWPCAGSR